MCLGADLVVGPICLITYGSHSGLLAQELVSGQQNSKIDNDRSLSVKMNLFKFEVMIPHLNLFQS